MFSFPLHLSFKTIAILSNINDLLFYLAVAFVIICLTRRYDYAATVLAAPVMLHCFAYYDIINEIFPAGSLLIMFVALDKYMEDRLLKKALLASCMFFVIWGHPAMLLTLFVFLPFIYSNFQRIKGNWKMIVFVLANVVIRSALLADYDMGKINLVNIHSICIHNLTGKAFAYLDEYWFIAAIVALMVYIIYRSGIKMAYAGLLILPVLLMYIDAYYKTFHISIKDPNVLKYLYPIHFFALLQGMVFIHALPAAKFRWYLAGLLFTLFAGLNKTLSYHTFMAERALVLKSMNTFCALQDSSHSKWYINVSETPYFAHQTLDQSNEGLVFSVRDKQMPNIHLVWATDELEAKLDTVGENKLLANGSVEFEISRLDKYYFDVRPGPYKKLLLDSAQLKFLKPYLR